MEKTSSTYYANHEQHLMYKLLSPTMVDIIQISGRDMTGFFRHRHERITFPSEERLKQALASMTQSSPEAWEDYMMEYLQVNTEKLKLIIDQRQELYNKGMLLL
jgi:hypothetical protein